MRKNSKRKMFMMAVLMIVLIPLLAACGSENPGKDTDKENVEADKDKKLDDEKETAQEDNNPSAQAKDPEATIETQMENEILQILGFSEEKDKIERYGMDDVGSDDQSIHVNDNEGDLELFLSISKESTGIDSAGDGPMVGLDVRHDIKRDKEAVSMMEDLTKELIKAISKYEYVDWVGVEHRIPKDNDSNINKALSVTIKRESLDKINWDTFDSDRLELISDSYSLADDLK